MSVNIVFLYIQNQNAEMMMIVTLMLTVILNLMYLYATVKLAILEMAKTNVKVTYVTCIHLLVATYCHLLFVVCWSFNTSVVCCLLVLYNVCCIITVVC